MLMLLPKLDDLLDLERSTTTKEERALLKQNRSGGDEKK